MTQPPSGQNRRDAIMWGLGVVLGTVATLLGSAGGARLGAALTGGVITLVATVLLGLARDSRDT